MSNLLADESVPSVVEHEIVWRANICEKRGRARAKNLVRRVRCHTMEGRFGAVGIKDSAVQALDTVNTETAAFLSWNTWGESGRVEEDRNGWVGLVSERNRPDNSVDRVCC